MRQRLQRLNVLCCQFQVYFRRPPHLGRIAAASPAIIPQLRLVGADNPSTSRIPRLRFVQVSCQWAQDFLVAEQPHRA
jgi:hypothetical protein